MDSANFRARSKASPPPAYQPVAHQQRFPHPSEKHLDADERRAAASKGAGPRQRNYHPPGGLKLTGGEWKLLGLIVIIAAFVRFYRLSHPHSVVFDEVHFGKFASKYIKTQYYVDVHPPLAKLLITFAAFVFGYDGNFDFKEIGKLYEPGVPYVAMRVVPATLGLALIPLTYLTLRGLDCRATTALIGSLFVAFENGLVTQSRLILLDSPLLFFTALTIFFWVGFCNEDKHQPFTDQWWLWLTLSGLGLGAVVSCKWVGLFTIATVGFSTIRHLWLLLGDLRISPRLWFKHFVARAICLIAVPVLFYMTMFAIHFAILGSSGEGDGFMSSEFQHTLGGRGMQDTFVDIGIGSDISIKHVNTQGGYLHSHAHDYPTGSKQQQITLYPHRDSNNIWRIMNATVEDPNFNWEIGYPLKYITNGMQVKLIHSVTQKKLHSHDVRPPVSEVDFQNEVSAYGAPGFDGDSNDNWIVEIEHGAREDKESWTRLRTLRTHFRLRHALQGCYLFSHKVKLPEWGYEQQEVTCNKNAIKKNSLWYVESAVHPLLPADAEKVNYKIPSFLSKFWELQKVMWITNAGLTDRHTYDSRPSSWPRLLRGINFWVKEHTQIYLLGNPFVWWLSTASVLAYAVSRGFLLLREQRGYKDFENSRIVKYDGICGFLFLGWALHYIPFYLMQRQLFLHHYFPALWFAILMFCAVFDLVTSSLRPRIRLYIGAVFIMVAIWVFARFSPLAYGNPWTKTQCENSKWLKTWDFSCNDFLNSYDDYSSLGHVSSNAANAPAATTIDGGRAPVVVVDDGLGNVPPPPEGHTTLARGGQAAPGHDIFAGDEKKDVKSAAPDDLDYADVEREVSTVLVQPTSPVVEEGAAKPDAQDEIPEKQSGPLQHDEQEAELAREGLFGDD